MTDPEQLAKEMRERALASDEPWVIYEKIYEPSEEQKKLFFNAGRWSAGARDYIAREAYMKLTIQGEL
jgi:hypothetical protein